jgi:hypothetical protein
MEAPGEDPYVVGEYAREWVQGLQGRGVTNAKGEERCVVCTVLYIYLHATHTHAHTL